MSRKPRNYNDSQYLHVIVQGVNREYIFDEHKCMKKYYEVMMLKLKNSNVRILAYCIMNNHAHILIYSEHIDYISEYMKLVNMNYAQFYNEYKDRVGHVFRDRFYSEPIRNERQLFNCISYIHFNPVVAGIVKSPIQYRYSSYRDYINKNNIVNDETIKIVFGQIKGYQEMFDFIHNSIGNAMDVVDEEFIKNYKCCININNIMELRAECRRLKNQRISNRKIAEMLKINRNKVDRALK